MRKTRYMRPSLNYFSVTTPDPLGVIRYAPEGDPAGGGGGAGDPPPKKDPPKEPKKIETTEEEVNEKIAKAVAKREKELTKSQEDKDKQADEERKKKQGEFEQLYNSEVEKARKHETEIVSLRLDGRKRDVKDKLRDYVATKHGDYATAIGWMFTALESKVSVELKDDDAEKLIKETVEKYVQDNPRSARPGVPAPPSHNKTNRDIPTTKDDGNGVTFHPTSVVARHF